MQYWGIWKSRNIFKVLLDDLQLVLVTQEQATCLLFFLNKLLVLDAWMSNPN